MLNKPLTPREQKRLSDLRQVVSKSPLGEGVLTVSQATRYVELKFRERNYGHQAPPCLARLFSIPR